MKSLSNIGKYPPVTTCAYSYGFGCLCILMSLIGCPSDEERNNYYTFIV